MPFLRVWGLSLVLALATACKDKPAPASPSPPTPAESGVRGRAVDVIDGAAAGGVSVKVGNQQAVTTDSAGFFETDVNTPGTYMTVVRGATIVERETPVTAPDDDARLTLIPASFDLTAFDELARSTRDQLQRWVSKPSLVVVVPVMDFSAASDDGYIVIGQNMTDLEVSAMIDHLTEGLALLTGGTYTSFDSTSVERPKPGDIVSVKRSGKIVVGRFSGITNTDGAVGLGTWLDHPDGSVTGGAMYLDHTFDREDSRRRLLRIHELGHALGYRHVTTRESIMNISVGPEPTDFDRAATRIVYQRPTGNKAPDRDPSPPTRVEAMPSGAGRWADPLP